MTIFNLFLLEFQMFLSCIFVSFIKYPFVIHVIGVIEVNETVYILSVFDD